MPETYLQTVVKLEELEPCPVRLIIHSTKKISHLEKTAKIDPNLLPPLEVAILKNKKYLVKRHSVFEALQRVGKTEFKANIHNVKNIVQVIILHSKMSQNSPMNPLAVLEMRDYLMQNGLQVADILDLCSLDPTYINLLKCDLSPQAKSKLSLLADMLSLRLNRVEIPPYVIEMISRRPKDVQEEIVNRICCDIGDEKSISDKDFVFPNPGQIRLYMEISKKPEERNALIFRREEVSDVEQQKTRIPYSISKTKQKEANAIIGNIPYMALMEINDRKFRLDWKSKTFTEIKEQDNEFIVIKDGRQLKKFLTFSDEQLKFLNLDEEQNVYFNNITTSKQLKKLAVKIGNNSEFKAILVLNKRI